MRPHVNPGADETVRIDNIPARLKAMRKRKDWSLDRTALETGVSKAMLGQIERAESSPTVATLWKIATGMGVSFSSLFADSDDRHATNDQQTMASDPGMRVKTVFPFSEDTKLEVFVIVLRSRKRVLRAPHRAGVVEHVIVMRGEMELLCGGRWRVLKNGESMRFLANQRHGYAARTTGTRFLNIISYT